MSEQGYGIIAALIAALAWGSYTVPLKRIAGVDPFRFQIWLSGGIATTSIAVGLWQGFQSFSLWGVGDGLYWSLGAALSFLAVQKEGLSGAAARWMGTAILVSFASGIFVLHESVQVSYAGGGILCLLAGLIFGTRDGHRDGVPSKVNSGRSAVGSAKILRNWRSFAAGFIFGTYFLPIHFSGESTLNIVAPLGVGIALGAVLIHLFLRPKPMAMWSHGWISMACGVAWNAASIASLFAAKILGLAIGFPLTQLALLVSIAWGVLVFNEAKDRASKVSISIAAILLLSGAVLLGASKL